MTGVGGRPEIIIEGTSGNDIDKAVWKVWSYQCVFILKFMNFSL